MGKSRGVHETTPEIRNRMIGMYEAGLALREIAAAVNCSQRTVKRWVNRFDKEGTVETKDRCGRKRITTQEEDEAIIRLATQTPVTAAKTVLPALGLKCSVDTVRERLHKAGIHNWSPSKKHLLQIPINPHDVEEIHKAVWRSTGTQFEKRKLTNEKYKLKNYDFQSQKKFGTPKIKSKQPLDENEVSNTRIGQSNGLQNFSFVTLSQNEQIQQQINGMQPITSSPPLPCHSDVPTNSNQYNQTLNLLPQFQPTYHHSGPTISQNWPGDLVQNTQHYPESQQNSIQDQQTLHNHTNPQLLTNHHQHAIKHFQDKGSPTYLQQHRILQKEISGRKLNKSKNIIINVFSNSDSNCNENIKKSSIVNSYIDTNSNKNYTVNNKHKDRVKKKKGGKIKGTLETSIEIRNRIIGMSEAGLSTLSIALAINRSERTVKRWLERWKKEGNVHTKERKGRKRITTKEQDAAIIAMATENPLTAAKYVAPALGLKCSVDTVRERLHKAGIHSWKLVKKQGNAIYGIHLWQPSGSRTNNIKKNKNKMKKSSKIKYKLNPGANKELDKNQREEVTALKTITPIANVAPEENYLQIQSQSQSLSIIHTTQDLPNSVVGLKQRQFSQFSICPQLSAPPQTLQFMGPMIHQRSDSVLSLSTVMPSMVNQASVNISYPYCMTGNNAISSIEQTDSINNEPYIWSF